MATGAEQDLPELLTASQLAGVLGVSPSTIGNWTKRERNPLKTVTTVDGAIRFTWFHLEEFRKANPRLPGLSKTAPLTTGQDQAPPAAAAELEELKSITRDLRNAAHASLQAALEAARLNEESARSHRAQLEHIAQTVAALDAALGTVTAPSTMND
jgi:hypothetical protein